MILNIVILILTNEAYPANIKKKIFCIKKYVGFYFNNINNKEATYCAMIVDLFKDLIEGESSFIKLVYRLE